MSLSVSVKNMLSFAPYDSVLAELPAAHATLTGHTGKGSDFLGWLSLPCAFDRDEVEAVNAAAAKIRSDSAVLLVIGIGGSYRVAIEFVKSPNYNLTARGTPKIFSPAIRSPPRRPRS